MGGSTRAPGILEELQAELAELIEATQIYAAAAQAPNTTRAYASDWAQFFAWAERFGLEPMPLRRARLRPCGC